MPENKMGTLNLVVPIYLTIALESWQPPKPIAQTHLDMTPSERFARRRKRRRILTALAIPAIILGIGLAWPGTRSRYARSSFIRTAMQSDDSSRHSHITIRYPSPTTQQTGIVEVEIPEDIPTLGEGVITLTQYEPLVHGREPELFAPSSIAVRSIPEESDALKHDTRRRWRWILSSDSPRQCSITLRLPFETAPEEDVMISTEMNDTLIGQTNLKQRGLGYSVQVSKGPYTVDYIHSELFISLKFTKFGMSSETYDVVALMLTIVVFLLGSGVAWKVVERFWPAEKRP